jgi:hypothetical protein
MVEKELLCKISMEGSLQASLIAARIAASSDVRKAALSATLIMPGS